MTYTDLTATTKLSELPAALNGVKTRSQPLVIDTANQVGTAAKNLLGDIQVWEWDTGEELYMTWPIPDRIDRAVNMTFKMVGAPATSEASVEVSFDIKVIAIDTTAGTLINGTTATVQVVDESVSGTAFTGAEITATLAAATFLGANVDTLGIEVTRVAATSDLVGDWLLVNAGIQYTVER